MSKRAVVAVVVVGIAGLVVYLAGVQTLNEERQAAEGRAMLAADQQSVTIRRVEETTAALDYANASHRVVAVPIGGKCLGRVIEKYSTGKLLYSMRPFGTQTGFDVLVDEVWRFNKAVNPALREFKTYSIPMGKTLYIPVEIAKPAARQKFPHLTVGGADAKSASPTTQTGQSSTL